MKSHSNLFLRCIFATAVILSGCEQRDKTESSSFNNDDSEVVLALVLDLSSSSIELFQEDRVGLQFTRSLIEHYQRAYPGRNGKLILAQLSGGGDPLLWEGNPTDLLRDYDSYGSLHQMLVSKSNPNGSRIHEGLSRTFDYLLKHRAVQDGARPAVFVLSDMLDNGADGTKYEQRVMVSLKEFGKRGGISGFYFVHQSQLERWRTNLTDAGVTDCLVSADIVARPPLPSFD
jgi:hypothetical protein